MFSWNWFIRLTNLRSYEILSVYCLVRLSRVSLWNCSDNLFLLEVRVSSDFLKKILFLFKMSQNEVFQVLRKISSYNFFFHYFFASYNKWFSWGKSCFLRFWGQKDLKWAQNGVFKFCEKLMREIFFVFAWSYSNIKS